MKIVLNSSNLIELVGKVCSIDMEHHPLNGNDKTGYDCQLPSLNPETLFICLWVYKSDYYFWLKILYNNSGPNTGWIALRFSGEIVNLYTI